MPKTYLLIDLQNRRPEPEDVARWIGDDGRVWIFFGDHEIGHLPEYLEIGSQVKLVPVSRTGKNSLDFLLVLYLGYLVAKSRAPTRFVVVAADMGYDSAVEHAKAEGFDVQRVEDLAEELGAKEPTAIVIAQADPAETGKPDVPPKEQKNGKIWTGILTDVASENPPHDLRALKRRIQSRLGTPQPERVDEFVARLEARGAIRLVDGELAYAAASKKGALDF